MKVNLLKEEQKTAWDDYVRNHSHGTLYHLSGWKNVIEKTYGHKSYYLAAEDIDVRDLSGEGSDRTSEAIEQAKRSNELNVIKGILPLIHIKHILFGNTLISMPFLDYGGILADDKNTEKALLDEAIRLAQELRASCIEMRHLKPLVSLNSDESAFSYELSAINCDAHISSHKVRMLLPVVKDSESIMKSFKSKLRSQIRKPIKEGCTATVGHSELLDDFYTIFAANMRVLGSPVHPKRFFKNITIEFPNEARICMVYKDSQPLAASVVIGFDTTLKNPWASSLREFSHLSPNMLLYWTMIEHACQSGYHYFDFGRSSPNEGTYKFKEQWGAKPTTLHWHYISLNGQPIDVEYSQKPKYQAAINVWKYLPIPITKVFGPMIRKYIGL